MGTALKRTITWPMLMLYGLGTILGAGIYVLVGEVANASGVFAPAAFLTAAIVAAFTGMSYAELSTRYPVSAGEVAYVEAAFGNRPLAAITGMCVILTGVVSAATIANGFVGYLAVFISVPESAAITLLVVTLGLLAAWGINESLRVAAVITLIEAAGLIIIVVLGLGDLGAIEQRLSEAIASDTHPGFIAGVLAGAHLAFYAYIGFEDMANVAEEVRDPAASMPRSIICALVAATVLYIAVAVVAVTSLSLDELRDSRAPLASILNVHGYSPGLISLIGLLAVVNGALVQIVMASRVVYGMAGRGLAPRAMGKVNEKTRTPLFATALVTASILAAALWLPLRTLAIGASTIALCLFMLVNAALIAVRHSKGPAAQWTCPKWTPYAGFATCLALTGFGTLQAVT
jgi:amino acid transporter